MTTPPQLSLDQAKGIMRHVQIAVCVSCTMCADLTGNRQGIFLL
jgi:hypothetical protein